MSVILAVAGAHALRADVCPASIFTGNAVLQQGIPVPVWGTASEGEKVTVECAGRKASTTAKDGRWLVRLEPLKIGGPYTMTIAGRNKVVFNNILVGEVWICGGQSNMAFELKEAAEAQTAIAAADDPLIRMFTVRHASTKKPMAEVDGVWRPCTAEQAAWFSAVGYFFGRDLRKALGVPVGIINASAGSSSAEAWTPRAVLEADPDLRAAVEERERAAKEYPEALARYKEQESDLLKAYEVAVEKARAEGKPAPRKPAPPPDPVAGVKYPSGLYNGMIVPLEPYGIRGVIWYQGESNSGRARAYQTLFPALIRSWREAWGEGEFPFLFVQVAPYEDTPPEIREAQLIAWRNTPRTAMVVITDAGDEKSIHPKRKEPVGARLALAARAVAYGERIEYSGPVFDSMTVDGGAAVLRFMHVGAGLTAAGGALKGFTLAGADKNFIAAEAKIEGDSVVVSSPRIAVPAAVRYGWANAPDVNLFNRDGLPATPFRTDPE